MEFLFDPMSSGQRMSMWEHSEEQDLLSPLPDEMGSPRSICESELRPDSAIGTGSNYSDNNLDCADFSDWTEEGSFSRTSPAHSMSDIDEPEYEENMGLYFGGFVNGGSDFDDNEHYCENKVLFCVECQATICLRCKAYSHLHHKTTTIRNAAFRRKTDISCLSERLAAKKVLLNEQLNRCENYEDSLRTNRETVEVSLQRRRDYYHRMVEHWYKKNQDHIKAIISYEMEKVNDNIQTITRALNELKETTDYISQLQTYTQPTDVLALSKELLPQVQSTDEDDLQSMQQELDQQIYFILNTSKAMSPSDLGEVTAKHVGMNQQAQNQLVSSGKLVFSFSTRQGPTCHYSATGLSIDTQGNFVVSDMGKDCVLVYKPNGQIVRCLDTLPFDEPTRAVPLGEDVLAVACKNNIKFFSAKDGSFGHSMKQNVYCPASVCVSQDNCHMIVTDMAEDGPLVYIYDTQDWELINTIIGGRRAPVFENPWYISTDASGNVIVSDLADHTVKIFNNRGILVKEIGGQGAQPGQFFRPAGVCTDEYGHILVADSGNHRVQMFNSRGDFCAVLVNKDIDGFINPMDLAIDSEKRLVVLQSDGVVGTYQYIY